MCALCQTRVYVPSSLHLSSSSGMVVLVVVEAQIVFINMLPGDLEKRTRCAEKSLFIAELIGRKGHYEVISSAVYALSSNFHSTTVR